LVFPKLPLQRKDNEFKGYKYGQFDYNGWVYELKSGQYDVTLASSPLDDIRPEPTKFLLRMRGPKNDTEPSCTLVKI